MKEPRKETDLSQKLQYVLQDVSFPSFLQNIPFSALFVLIASFVAVPSEAQILEYPAYSAVYSPYAYGSYYGYAAYPAFYGWGSNKGAAPAAAPNTGKLTNNQ